MSTIQNTMENTIESTIDSTMWPVLGQEIEETQERRPSLPKFDKKSAIGTFSLATGYDAAKFDRLQAMKTTVAASVDGPLKTKGCWHVARQSADDDFGVCTHLGCTFAHSFEELRVRECRFASRCNNEQCNFFHPDLETKREYFERRTDLDMPDLPETSENTYKPRAQSEPQFVKKAVQKRTPAVLPVSKPVQGTVSFASIVSKTETVEVKAQIPQQPKEQKEEVKEKPKEKPKEDRDSQIVTVNMSDATAVPAFLKTWIANCAQGITLIVGNDPDCCVLQAPRDRAEGIIDLACKFPSFKFMIPPK